MAQIDIELILFRQLAGCLGIPAFLVNESGDLLFYNESAEGVLGRRFEDTGPLPVGEWSRLFQPMSESGVLLEMSSLPLVIAVRERRPSHRSLFIQGLDGVRRKIQVTAFPLIGQGGHLAGAVALFWEDKET